MTTVTELQAGDVVPMPIGGDATFVAQTKHPVWPHLRLVIWRVPEAAGLSGNWSHDALDPRQDVGQAISATATERADRVRAALLGDGGEG